ncbi:MAG: hypothetical protein Kow0069_38340 [Promethearchaeota archaeon]
MSSGAPDPFDRQRLIPWWHQAAVEAAKVAVVGVGGTGCTFAVQAARTGVGELHLFDNDVVEASNLNRQFLYSPRDVGRPKARAAAEALRDRHVVGPTRVVAHQTDVLEDWRRVVDVLARCDLVFNALDLPEVKRLPVASACLKFGVPTIFAGTDPHGGNSGVVLYQPSKPGAPCYECLQAVLAGVPEEVRRALSPSNVVVAAKFDLNFLHGSPWPPPGAPPGATRAATCASTAALVTSFATSLATRVLHGLVDGLPHRLLVDAYNYEVEAYALDPRPDCYLCGPS